MFLNYLMLMGLGAAAIPLVLHLLSRARYRTVDWGAMIFLRGADARHRQATRLNQILLVLVRMALIAVLAIALSRPVVRGNWFGAAREQRLTAAIVLDCSASMAYDENGRNRFELARGVARQVLGSLRRGDRVILMLAGRPANEQDLRPTPELRAVDARLASLQPAYGSADLFGAMSRAWEQLAEHEPLHRQMYVITDRQALSWNRVTGEAKAPWLDPAPEQKVPTDLFVIPVGGMESDNVLVESVDLLDPPAIRGQPVEIEVKLRNFGSVQRAGLPLVLTAGSRKIYEAKVNLAPNASSSFKASIKEGFPSAGSEVVTAAITSTRYTSDDQLQRVIEIIDPIRVLVLSGDERPAGNGGLRGESDFVRVALAPFQTSTGQAGRDPCTVEVKTVEQWPEIAFGAYDVVILANVERFDAKQVRELEQFVYVGGGLLIAPGNLSRVENYNELFYRGGSGVMPAELFPATPGDGSQATTLLGWRPEHPVFRFLRGRPDPMPSSTIGRYFPARPHKPDARSLAEYVSGLPFLIETPRGERERRGRVILMTTPLDIDWGNLPFSNFYLPFTQSLMRYLSGGVLDDRNLAPGAIIQGKLDPSPLNRTVTVQRPGGAKPIPLELIRYGDQAEVRYGDTRPPGEYRMVINEEGKPPRTVHYVVTPPRDESDMTQLDENGWQKLQDDLGFKRLDTSEEPIAAVMSASRDGRELWSLLIGGVILIGVLELGVARAFSRMPKDVDNN